MVRLVEHLKSLGLSNRAAREAMATGKVWVGPVPTADAGRWVEPGDVRYRPDAPRLVVGRDPLLVHVDAELVVAWKPPGMLSVAAPGRRDEGSLVGWVARRFDGAFAVHRLDEGTSGLVVVARTKAAREGLKALFESHDVERGYLALVAGAAIPAPVTVNTQLVRNRGDGLRGSLEVARARVAAEEAEGKRAQWPKGDARPAITHLRQVRGVGRGVQLVAARLETGRTHQVRIHLAELGRPVLGDPLYAPPAVARRFPRTALHAAVLGFVHPVTGEPMRWEVPLADDMEAFTRNEGG